MDADRHGNLLFLRGDSIPPVVRSAVPGHRAYDPAYPCLSAFIRGLVLLPLMLADAAMGSVVCHALAFIRG
jgi:hypothetical protein